jgi:predicted membrane channel-forming protein YqfA (hemolysin III family)
VKDILKSKKFWGMIVSIASVVVGMLMPEKAEDIRTILYIIAGWAGLHTLTDVAYALKRN